MAKKYYMFAEDSDGYAREVKVDPANKERQKAELERLGFSVSILDEDERIKYGLIWQRMRGNR